MKQPKMSGDKDTRLCSNASAKKAVSRRGFLAATAAIAGGAAMAATAGSGLQALAKQEHESVEEEVFGSFCRGNCGSFGCGLNVHVREGKVIRVSPMIFPDADDAEKGRSRSCLRGISNGMRMYAPNRVDYPLRRAGERGEGKWERISWEEAIKTIADTWKKEIGEYGPASVAHMPIYGNFSFGVQASLGWNRLMNSLGSSSFISGADRAQSYALTVFSGGAGFGTSPTLWAGNVKTFVIWGSNMAESAPHEWRYVLDAQRAGARVVTLDPRNCTTVAQADEQIVVRPGTDGALAMTLCNYLIENNMIDEEFLRAHTNAPCLVDMETGLLLRANTEMIGDGLIGTDDILLGPVAPESGISAVFLGFSADAVPNADGVLQVLDAIDVPALRGSYAVGGKAVRPAFDYFAERMAEWPLERGAQVTGVSEEDIVRLANMYADGSVVVVIGNAINHVLHGFQTAFAIPMVSALTGNLLKVGTGCSSQGAGGNFGFFSDQMWAYMTENVAGPVYSMLDAPEIISTGMEDGHPAPVKSVILYTGNWLGTVPNRKKILDCLDNLDLFVVCDMSMTDSAHYADIVLPVGHWFEVPDCGSGPLVPYAIIGEAAVQPLFEHKSDFEICSLLAEAMDVPFDMTEDEVATMAVDNAGILDLEGNPVTRERLIREKAVRTIPDEFAATPESVTSECGRIPIYWECPVPFAGQHKVIEDVERERLPYWEPPAEAWPYSGGGFEQNPLAQKYPLIFQSLHSRFTTHTTYNHVEWLEELRGEPIVYMNPSDAETRGIAEGQLVKVYNDRGYVVVKAAIDDGLMAGIVNLPHGWDVDHFIEGHYQDLTLDVTTPTVVNENYYDCLCEIEMWGE